MNLMGLNKNLKLELSLLLKVRVYQNKGMIEKMDIVSTDFCKSLTTENCYCYLVAQYLFNP